ncbi:MAG: DUF2235 domain-containing protein [Halieaceae bacterium]|nr:DUF2235 domain-containing protein [Halieaceae bacterium]
MLALSPAFATADTAVSREASASTDSAPQETVSSRRLVLCLDGTWNSDFDETRTETGSYVLKPTNVLKLCRSVEASGQGGVPQIAYYLTGVGAVSRFPGFSNAAYYTMDRFLGGVWGAGFENNVEAAVNFLAQNFEPGDEVFIFGFSRGAATARGVTQFLNWAGGLPVKADAYYLPLLFREFIRVHGDGRAAGWLAGVNQQRADEGLPALETFNRIPVTYLGVWDTVMALGSRFEETGEKNATDTRSFYVDEQPAEVVKHARQALAIDERRYDFRPEVWLRARQGQTMEQRWFPGVHSNVGGGYRYDGLANGALRWVLAGAEEAGLGLNRSFLNHYRPYPQDTLYNTYSRGAAVIDTLRFKRRAGVRRMDPYPGSANLAIDPSVALRMISDPKARTEGGEDLFPRMNGIAYRPDNLLEFLACDASAQTPLARLSAELRTDEQRLRLQELLASERKRRCDGG